MAEKISTTEHIEGRGSTSDNVEARFTPIVQETLLELAEAERKLLRKLDYTILPWIIVIYFVSYMDRANMGNVRNIGLAKDLHLSSWQYQWAASAFYFGTLICGTAGGLMLKIVRPSRWLGFIMISWGLCATLQAVCTNAAGLIVVRFFLGVTEATVAPGCAFYLSFWYLKNEIALRIASYAGTSAISGVVGGLISYGLGSATHLMTSSWKAVFIVEGIPTILIGVLTFWVLPDRPENGRSHWFTEAEHALILQRRGRNVKNDDHGINFQQVKACFLDYRLYFFTVIYFGLSMSLAVVAVFLPTIINDLGYTAIKANLMTVPIYGASYIALLISSKVSDYTRQRGIISAIGCLISAVGFVLLGEIVDLHVRYGMSFLACVGTYMAFPVMLAWISNTFAADSKSAVGLGAVIALTQVAGIAASQVFPISQAPQYRTGCAVTAGLMFLGFAGNLAMRFSLSWENKVKDRKYGKPEAGIAVVMGDEADKAEGFRYIL